MKSLAFLTLCALALFSGCDSMSSRVHERFAPIPPHVRTFAADRRAVFTAAQTAVKNIDLLVGRTSLTKGSIEAYAPIRQGDITRDTRQTTLQINLTETDSGDTDVALLVVIDTEGSFPGGVSQEGQREHSLYELYFAALQQVLLENGALKVPAKP